MKPENHCRNNDLVFAKGRAAMEALCGGNAVVVCDSSGAGRWLAHKILTGCGR